MEPHYIADVGVQGFKVCYMSDFGAQWAQQEENSLIVRFLSTLRSMSNLCYCKQMSLKMRGIITFPLYLFIKQLYFLQHFSIWHILFLQGYLCAPKCYIATQAPLHSTIGDFWQMVWEQKSQTILMLTGLEEQGVVRNYYTVFPLFVATLNRAHPLL